MGAEKLIAAAADELPTIPGWGQLGIAGIVIAAFYTDKVVTGKKYNEAIAERDAERARTEKAETFLRDKVSEMVTESTLALRTVDAEVLPLLRGVNEALPLLQSLQEVYPVLKEVRDAFVQKAAGKEN